MLHSHHEPSLVALSFLVACLGSYAALQLAGRVVVAEGRARLLWLVGSAFTIRAVRSLRCRIPASG